MRINNNTSAFNVWTSYSKNVKNMQASMSKLSTGEIANTDDPAGIGISERMRAQIESTEMARSNTDNAISMLQTSDSWMQTISDQLSRMKALAVEAQGIVSEGDKENIQSEFESLQAEITRVTSGYTSAAKFNGLALLRGGDGIVDMTADTVDQSKSLTVQVGADIKQTINISLVNLDKTNMKEIGEIKYFTDPVEADVTAKKTAYDTALQTAVNTNRAAAGAAPATFAGYDYTTPTQTTDTAYLNADGKTLEEYVNEQVGKSGMTNGELSVSFSYLAAGAQTGTPAEFDTTVGGVTVHVSVSADETTNADVSKGHWADFVSVHEGDNGTAAVKTAKGDLAIAQAGEAKSETVKWSDVLTTYTVDTENVVGKLEVAIDYLSKARANIAAQQVRLNNTSDGLLSYQDNLSTAESQIRDIDMASETTEFNKYNVMTQAANAMLAQANSLPQNVLSLLQ